MIESIYFLPHGMQIIQRPEIPKNANAGILHNEMELIRNELKKDNPDLIILLTPHGYNLEDQFAIYLHNKFRGNYYVIEEGGSVVNGELIDTQYWEGDEVISKNLLNYLRENKFPMQGLIQGFADYPLTLAWGETVPLYYLPPELNTKLLVIGIPRSRHDSIMDIQDDLYKLGQLILEFVETSNDKISMIFSGDLSHTHVENGPYGYHQSSKEFDNLIQDWSKEITREKFEKILQLQSTALACGMAGISMIQGIHDKYPLSYKTSVYDLPTYFGMIVNQWKIDS